MVFEALQRDLPIMETSTLDIYDNCSVLWSNVYDTRNKYSSLNTVTATTTITTTTSTVLIIYFFCLLMELKNKETELIVIHVTFAYFQEMKIKLNKLNHSFCWICKKKKFRKRIENLTFPQLLLFFSSPTPFVPPQTRCRGRALYSGPHFCERYPHLLLWGC